jgi:hypothetical protein
LAIADLSFGQPVNRQDKASTVTFNLRSNGSTLATRLKEEKNAGGEFLCSLVAQSLHLPHKALVNSSRLFVAADQPCEQHGCEGTRVIELFAKRRWIRGEDGAGVLGDISEYFLIGRRRRGDQAANVMKAAVTVAHDIRSGQSGVYR